jgi:NAD(P)-dependent dehydrogenase (short-subunit alcohol dehydrogenase family)
MAIELAACAAKVIIACRDQLRGQAVIDEIVALGFEAPQLIELDLNDLESVSHFVERLAGVNHIDILINNAGVMATRTRELTKQGYEKHFGVNYLAHFRLTNLLVLLPS